VTARTPCLTYHEDVNRAQLAHSHVQIEILVNPPDMRLEKLLDLRVLQTGNIQVSNLGEENAAIAVDSGVDIQVNLSPRPNQYLVAGTDDVIRRDGNSIHGSKRCWHILKEAEAVDGKRLAQRRKDHPLKVGELDSFGRVHRRGRRSLGGIRGWQGLGVIQHDGGRGRRGLRTGWRLSFHWH